MKNHKAKYTGIVLAGGLSSRMGRDKSRMEWQGQSLLERAVDLLTPLCAELLISANTGEERLYGQRVIADKLPSRGPLSGIHASLTESRTQMNILIPCDMPLLTPGLISHLMENALPGRVSLPYLQGESMPLPAVLPRGLAPLLEENIQKGEYKLMKSIYQADPVLISCDRFDVREFRNINRPEDFDRLSDD